MDATNRIKKPRKRFNLTDLDNSNVFYNISICLFYAQWHYYEDTDNPILDKLNMGWNYYDSILDNVKDLNRCFIKLIKENEYNAALPLIRLQMDNLCVMYAEYLYPEKILLPILENGKELGRIKIDGDYIRAKALVDKLATQYEPLTTIWMDSCCYVHPSKKREEASISTITNPQTGYCIKDRQKEKKYLKDMVLINQVILDVLNIQLDFYIIKLKEKGTYKDYRKNIKRIL